MPKSIVYYRLPTNLQWTVRQQETLKIVQVMQMYCYLKMMKYKNKPILEYLENSGMRTCNAPRRGGKRNEGGAFCTC